MEIHAQKFIIILVVQNLLKKGKSNKTKLIWTNNFNKMLAICSRNMILSERKSILLTMNITFYSYLIIDIQKYLKNLKILLDHIDAINNESDYRVFNFAK